jgi:hypothetical protein
MGRTQLLSAHCRVRHQSDKLVRTSQPKARLALCSSISTGTLSRSQAADNVNYTASPTYMKARNQCCNLLWMQRLCSCRLRVCGQLLGPGVSSLQRMPCGEACSG